MDKVSFAMILLSVLLFSCDQQPVTSTKSPMKVPERKYEPEKLALGNQVYDLHCKSCHGVGGEGNQNWRKRDANGKFPPPPLNGTGHTWHHPVSVLKGQIENGGIENGGTMPAFGDKLNEKEIEAVISWIQSKWPENVYNAWYEMQHQ